MIEGTTQTASDPLVDPREPREPLDERNELLLRLFVDAFERYEMDALTSVIPRLVKSDEFAADEPSK